MKATTKPVTVRLVQNMIDEMNNVIEEGKLYSNKPDMIVWMMREYYSYIVYAISTMYKVLENALKRDPEIKKLDPLTVVKGLVFYGECDPDKKYGIYPMGKPILIRVPERLYENIMKLNLSLGSPFYTIQDFCRFAITSGLENERSRNETLEAFIELRDTSNDENLIKRIVEEFKSPYGRTNWKDELGP